MAKRTILWQIKKLGRGVFTTHQLSALSGKSSSGVTQALNILERQGLIFKIHRGIWAETGNSKLSAYTAIPFLLPRHRSYVSFISALHLYGIIEQIPNIITLATTAHTRAMRTKLGTYSFHQLRPCFFAGFDWYKGGGSFLIADPEKALIDCLYISTRKKKQFANFPELYLPKSFSPKKAKAWINKIPDYRIRACVRKRLKSLLAA